MWHVASADVMENTTTPREILQIKTPPQKKKQVEVLVVSRFGGCPQVLPGPNGCEFYRGSTNGFHCGFPLNPKTRRCPKERHTHFSFPLFPILPFAGIGGSNPQTTNPNHQLGAHLTHTSTKHGSSQAPHKTSVSSCLLKGCLTSLFPSRPQFDIC